MLSSYEELRKKNIEDNKRILAEIGLRNPFKPVYVRNRQLKRKRRLSSSWEVNKKRQVEVDENDLGTTYSSGRRRSARIKGDVAPSVKDIQEEVDKEALKEETRKNTSLANRPFIYGAVPGVDIGTWWSTRIECNHANIHRPTVAGIHPGPEGAYSIALSGGYEDDVDMGDCFTYTGEGGRDLKGTAAKPKNLRTAPQSRDQKLSRGNAALVKSVETKKPVRVIRGYKLQSPFAPEEGYRYDGLYLVDRYWYTTGMSGFGVFKFALRRLPDQPPPPWYITDAMGNSSDSITTNNDDNNNNVDKKDGHNSSRTNEMINDGHDDGDDMKGDARGSTSEVTDESEHNKDQTGTEQ